MNDEYLMTALPSGLERRRHEMSWQGAEELHLEW